MYTRIIPKIIYFTANSLLAKEYETKFPILYPLVNLIDLGITNYYDVTGSLNLSMNQLIENEKLGAWKEAEIIENKRLGKETEIKPPFYFKR